jgi:hypothetical protein
MMCLGLTDNEHLATAMGSEQPLPGIEREDDLLTFSWPKRWGNIGAPRSTDNRRAKSPRPAHVESSANTRAFAPYCLGLDDQPWVEPEPIERQNV